MTTSASLELRHMHARDVPQVMEVERHAFTDAWSAKSYYFEVNQSAVSHMVVLERIPTEMPPHATLNSLQRLVQQLRNQPTATTPQIIGFGGLWCIQEEAHISTIAVDHRLRGNGYGEILLAGMLKKAILLEAQYVVLEVRVSNTVAQRLYHKYGFTIEETKYGYYHDGENAYDMRLMLTDTSVSSQLAHLFTTLSDRHTILDNYVHTPHPRLGF